MPDFFRKRSIIYDTSFPGYIVAAEDEEFYGVLVLEWKNQQRPKEEHSLTKAASSSWKKT